MSTSGNRNFVRNLIAKRAGTKGEDKIVIDSAVDLILEYLHVRECYKCGDITLHKDNYGEYVKCKKCGSMDTRRL